MPIRLLCLYNVLLLYLLRRWFQLGLKNTAAIAAANAAKKIARQLAKLSKQNPASAVGGEEGDESGSDSEIEAGEDAEEEDIEGVNENTFGYIDDNGDVSRVWVQCTNIGICSHLLM